MPRRFESEIFYKKGQCSNKAGDLIFQRKSVRDFIGDNIFLYAGSDGESHFEDLSTELSLTDFAASAPPLYLSPLTPASKFSFFGAPAGWQSDWHPSSDRNLFVVVSGEWEVTASDGETRRFACGSVLLVEDTSGKGHTSRVVGTEDSLALLMQLPQLSGET